MLRPCCCRQTLRSPLHLTAQWAALVKLWESISQMGCKCWALAAVCNLTVPSVPSWLTCEDVLVHIQMISAKGCRRGLCLCQPPAAAIL